MHCRTLATWFHLGLPRTPNCIGLYRGRPARFGRKPRPVCKSAQPPCLSNLNASSAYSHILFGASSSIIGMSNSLIKLLWKLFYWTKHAEAISSPRFSNTMQTLVSATTLATELLPTMVLRESIITSSVCGVFPYIISVFFLVPALLAVSACMIAIIILSPVIWLVEGRRSKVGRLTKSRSTWTYERKPPKSRSGSGAPAPRFSAMPPVSTTVPAAPSLSNPPAVVPHVPSFQYPVPLCAENGSCYGDISSITGLTKTVHVH